MSKTIKVTEEVFQRLRNAQEKRETYSQTVERLLKIREHILDFITVVEGMVEYQEFQQYRRHATTPPSDQHQFIAG